MGVREGMTSMNTTFIIVLTFEIILCIQKIKINMRGKLNSKRSKRIQQYFK